MVVGLGQSQSIVQSVNQSIDPSVNHLINQAIRRAIDQNFIELGHVGGTNKCAVSAVIY